MCYYSLVVNFLLDSEVDDEIIDERPLENKSENDNNLVNHVTEQNAAVSFSDEDEQKVRYCRKKIGGKLLRVQLYYLTTVRLVTMSLLPIRNTSDHTL